MDSNFRFRVPCKIGHNDNRRLRLHAAVAPLSAAAVGGHQRSRPKRNLGTEALSRAEPEVRFHLPAASHTNLMVATDIGSPPFTLGKGVGNYSCGRPRALASAINLARANIRGASDFPDYGAWRQAAAIALFYDGGAEAQTKGNVLAGKLGALLRARSSAYASAGHGPVEATAPPLPAGSVPRHRAQDPSP